MMTLFGGGTPRLTVIFSALSAYSLRPVIAMTCFFFFNVPPVCVCVCVQVRVVKSAKDRSFEAIRTTVVKIRNHIKINDWNGIQTDFDECNKHVEKSKVGYWWMRPWQGGREGGGWKAFFSWGAGGSGCVFSCRSGVCVCFFLGCVSPRRVAFWRSDAERFS